MYVFDVSLLGADEMAYLPFVPQVEGNSISSGDDTTTTVNIGVSFPFGGTSFSTLYVSINVTSFKITHLIYIVVYLGWNQWNCILWISLQSFQQFRSC